MLVSELWELDDPNFTSSSHILVNNTCFAQADINLQWFSKGLQQVF